MKTGSISSKFIKSQMRFDGSFHLSDGLEVRALIQKSPYGTTLISAITDDIYCPGIFRRNYVNTGVPFLGGSDIQKQEYDSGKFLSKTGTPNYKTLRINRGWSLVTCGGTIGDTVFANNLLSNCWISQHVMRVIPNGIKEGMLYAYLASNYGKLLLTTNTYGSVIPTLNAENIGSLPIPLFPISFQTEVDTYIQESAKYREDAYAALNRAKNILSQYIGETYHHNSYKTGKVSSRDIISSLQHRLDPPALIDDGVIAMKEVCSHLATKTINSINVTVYRPGIFKRSYVKDGIPYIKGSEIFLSNPFRRCEHLSRTRTPFIDQMALYEGQILVTCAGSVGCIKMITKEYEDKKAIGSQDIIRLESNDSLYTSEYLFIYLQMPFVFDYIQSMKYGSVIERIEPFHIESIPVVTPTRELSNEITSIVKQYLNCTYRAFVSEEKAIQIVENEISSWK